MFRPSRRTVLTAGIILTAAASRAVSAAQSFALRTGVKAVLSARQSAICHVADYGASEILLLIVNGTLIDVHARRNGIYYPKDPALSRSVRTLAPVDLNRLIAAAGGVDQPVNGSARAEAFHTLFNGLKPVPLSRVCPPGGCLSPGKLTALPVTDPALRDWAFAHDPIGAFLTFSSPTVKAVWSLES